MKSIFILLLFCYGSLSLSQSTCESYCQGLITTSSSAILLPFSSNLERCQIICNYLSSFPNFCNNVKPTPIPTFTPTPTPTVAPSPTVYPTVTPSPIPAIDATAPKFVTYINQISSWWPPTSIVKDIGLPGYASKTAYNILNLAFWLKNGGAVDVGAIWADPLKYFSVDNPWGKSIQQIQQSLIKIYHSQGIKVLISAFGATEFPTTQGFNAVDTCRSLAEFVKNNNLDGVDLDYEDNGAMEQGKAEQWLIDCTKTIREILPKGSYLLTHAPQAPYFMGTSKYPNGGYLKIHKEVGDLIDFYNIQFYNQDSSTYDSFSSLFTQSNGWSTKTSVKELIANGIPSEKIVIGKPVCQADAYNTGLVSADNFKSYINQAKGAGIKWNAGVMTWQYSSDRNGAFINLISGAFSNPNPSPSPTVTPTVIPTTITPTTTTVAPTVSPTITPTKVIPTVTPTPTVLPTPSPTILPSPTPANNLQVGVYYGNWKIYGRGYDICKIPGEKISRIFYGFWDPSSGECKFNDAWADLDKPGPIDGKCGSAQQAWDAPIKGNVYQLIKFKERFPNVKVYVSVGGWTYSKAFHNYISTDEARKKMAQSCGALINQYSQAFDGLDIDLEYPCLPDDASCGDGITPTSDDRGNFLKLMQEFRTALPANKYLTMATGASPSKINALDLTELNKIVDSYNIMTYDFTSGSWGDAYTGHQTNARSSPNDPVVSRRQFSTELAASYMVSKGAAKNKINLGVAFYGRGFLIEKSASPNPFVKSLGGIKEGTWEPNSFDYYDLKAKYITSTNVYWDDISKAPYIFDTDKGYFISFDDKRSVAEKVNIAKNAGYEGVFSWEISADSTDYELTTAMRS